MTKKPAASTPSRAKRGPHRGLLIGQEHIRKFFDPDKSKRKTHEIRNFNIRCVPKGGDVFLVECGLKDAQGRGVFKVWGRAEFRGNTFVAHEVVNEHFKQHRCDAATYQRLSSSWSSDKGGCVLWEFAVQEQFKTPLYFAPKHGEDRTELELLLKLKCDS